MFRYASPERGIGLAAYEERSISEIYVYRRRRLVGKGRGGCLERFHFVHFHDTTSRFSFR